MNIFEALRKDHDKQRTLLDILINTQGDSEGRDEVFPRLKAHLEAHAAAEEEHFYTLLMEHDLTREKARHSVAEHHDIDELIEAVEQSDPSTSAWMAHMKNLREKVLHHLEEEEQEVFQLAGKALTESEKGNKVKPYRAEMERHLEEKL